MKRKILFISVAIFVVFALSMSLLGAKSIKLHRDYTLAVPIFVDIAFPAEEPDTDA